jgi:hypothetical protein
METSTVTLSGIFKENSIGACQVLKMDCEGAEYGILFSSQEILPKIQQIIMEYHEPKHFDLPSEYSLTGLMGYLKGNGFHVILKKTHYYQGIIYAFRKDVRNS